MQSPTSPRHDFQQLPLPTTVNTAPAQRPQGGTTVSTMAGHNAPPPRSLPHVVGRLSGEMQAPNSPIQSSFPHLHSTHAGGIQPSMSFFRPSRPKYDTPDLSRPSSLASVNDIEDPAHDSVSFQLGELNQRHSDVCDDDGSRAVSEIDTNLFPKRTKPSREPLLPTADPSGNLLSRLSLSRDRSGTGSSSAAKNIVRTSFDRVMGLSRGLSFDSVRKTSPTRPALIEGRPGKEGDGLNAYTLPTSPTRYERTSFAAMYPDTSTDNRNSGLRTSISHSPGSLFNPRPPNHQPPLSAVPILNLDTKKPSLNHQLHPSNNKFFLGGRFLTGGDSPWAFVTSFLLVLVIAGVWFGTTCVWWWQNESPAVAAIGIYMALLVISTMLATVC
jgi:palmitoyltransferase ZDHHC9/14/18